MNSTLCKTIRGCHQTEDHTPDWQQARLRALAAGLGSCTLRNSLGDPQAAMARAFKPLLLRHQDAQVSIPALKKQSLVEERKLIHRRPQSRVHPEACTLEDPRQTGGLQGGFSRGGSTGTSLEGGGSHQPGTFIWAVKVLPNCQTSLWGNSWALLRRARGVGPALGMKQLGEATRSLWHGTGCRMQ